VVCVTLFKTPEFVEFSLNQWLRRLPVQMTEQHLRLSASAIARIPEVAIDIIGSNVGSADRQ
jgi:oxalate decarboxylase